MRATLKIGNLLTGNALVAINFYPDAQAAELSEFGGYVEIPTLATGFDRLEIQVGQVLTKLNALPIGAALKSLDATLDSIELLASSPEAQALPATLNATLAELQTRLDDLSPDSESGERLNQLMGRLNQAIVNLDAIDSDSLRHVIGFLGL